MPTSVGVNKLSIVNADTNGVDCWILTAQSKDGGVIDCYPEASPDDYLFDDAKPLADHFPAGAHVEFSDHFPQARKLEDFQPNTMGALIVSRRVRDLLDGLGVENAEYLPVAVKDHRGDVVAPDYAILNLIGSEPAIDMKASVVRMSHLDEDQISSVKKRGGGGASLAARRRLAPPSHHRRRVPPRGRRFPEVLPQPLPLRRERPPLP